MFALLLAPQAHAAPTDAEIHAAAEGLYGRTLPEGAVCAGRPTALPERFEASVAVGVRRGHRGCVLVGVMIDERLEAIEEAAAAAVDAGAWDGLTAEDQAADLLAWTQQILLAFDTATGPGTAARTATGFEVSLPFLRRNEASGGTTAHEGTWSFDATAGLTDEALTPGARFTTTLTVRDDRLTGNLSADLVQATLQQKGQVIKDCFNDAWADDLALSGRTMFTWTVAGGEVDALTVIEEEGLRIDLAKCYASALRRLEFPEEAAGTVRWVFAVGRSEVTDP